MTLMQPIPRFVCGIALLGGMFVSTAQAYLTSQTLSLSNGWNAIFLEVVPEDPRCDSVFSNWPVASVNAYVAQSGNSSYVNDSGTALSVIPEYLVWQPGQPAGVNSLNMVMAGKAYLVFATESFQREVTGRPVDARMDWMSGSSGTNVYTLAGFRTDGTTTFGTFFASSGFNIQTISVYTPYGTNTYGPQWQRYGFTSVAMLPLARGKAYMIASDKPSTFSGPLEVSPPGGIFIPTNSSRSVLKLANRHNTNLTVSVTLRPSVTNYSGALPAVPDVRYFDSLSGWTNELSDKVLQPGEEWTIPVSVNRSGMEESETYGAVISITHNAGGLSEIPLEVDYGQPDPAHALWPAGLWVGKARMDKVTQVLGDRILKEGVEAGSALEFRLILHVDVSNRCSLLQRVILAGPEDTNGNWNASLYIDEAHVPAGAKSARISSVAFGLQGNGISPDHGFDRFGEALHFSYAIAHDDPVNPFYHPYHPNHDGLEADFVTPTASGDDFDHYMNEIKPELFSISNKVRLVWSEAPASGGGAIGWNPAEAVSGTIEFEVGNLRWEGPITMEGQFELRRVSKMGVLARE